MKLRDDLFYLIVFGPGFGESIVLRTPETGWVVVDGCRLPGAGEGQSPAVKLLQQHEAQWSAVVLTHPHLDHASGLDDVLAHGGNGPIGCYPHPLGLPQSGNTADDPEAAYRAGSVEQVLAAIHDCWEQNPETRWEIKRDTSRTVGPLRLTALHPDSNAVRQAEVSGNRNRLSTVLLAEWKNCRLLLGADAEATDWASIAEEYPDLAAHTALKYPHHGSAGAWHAAYATENDGAATWLMTPYNRGHKLPRFEDGQGLHRALMAHAPIHLTGLPARHDLQRRTPFETTRQALRDGHAPQAATKSLPGGFNMTIKPQATAFEGFVAAGFDADGNLIDLQRGAGAVTINEETSSA
ncbi:hypothetical protein GCM10022228_13650 [Halomonas cibimaris]|uniref:Metallo-beta-lactamase domain-containing protein n=1 Tax=Halomonas cibimaris TaxID=657012 RepID=A0ABP7LPH5_9GAMM